MKKKILKVLTTLITASTVMSIVPTTMAFALDAGDFESKVKSKFDKMNVTNDTDEDDIEKIIKNVKNTYDDFDDYDVDIDDFDKDKATREDDGKITFTLNVNDYDDDEEDDNDATEFDVSLKISKIQTYVYAKLPELSDKYIKISDSSIEKKAVDGTIDTSKYVVTNKEMDSLKLVSGTGWQTINGSVYYIDSQTYNIKKGWANINNSLYHFDETTGKVKTGWNYYNSKWYFLNNATNTGDCGKVLTGFKIIDGVTYYLSEQQNGDNIVTNNNILPNYGAMATGWGKSGNTWYYFNGNGSMQRGWKQIGSYWYYFNPENGSMASDTTIDGYKLAKSGQWIR